MGYGLLDMGYGRWVIGYGIWDMGDGEMGRKLMHGCTANF
jgi:hypothetical protein